MWEDILLQVNKPGRYIGQEWNMPKKDFSKAGIKFALCFPDLYELGMSNLGLRIIYAILNNIADVSCERFFSVAVDMEDILRRNHIEIFSLESKKRLKEFDIIGFSLGYELNYTNVLNILDLGNIPLKSSWRDNNYPLVIGGGPCTLNPEPIHEFFDLFVLGEGEEVILEIIDIYRNYRDRFKTCKISRQDLLVILSGIEGIYVPSLYEVEYTIEGKIEEFKPKVTGVPVKIKKRFVKDLDKVLFPSDWLLPYIQIVHDRITLEIMRGCPNSCCFCQARSQYFPFRQRNLSNILNLANETYKRTGYEELSLSGLSISDYSDIEELLNCLVNQFQEDCMCVSIPSLRSRDYVGRLASLIAKIKKTGLTFAPEAASERLRKILAKDFDTEGFFKVIKQAYLCGYKHVKLYFMIGLPSEAESDLDAIIDFAIKVSDLKSKIGLNISEVGIPQESSKIALNKSAGRVNISINTLIPKPHTALQWLKTQDLDSIKYKQDYIRKQTRRNKRLKFSFYNPYMSILEAILSRGDRRLSQVIFYAFKRQARFDAWDNHFRPDKWTEAFRESGVKAGFYLQKKSEDELLPWDFLDVGISKERLRFEFNKFNKLIEMK